MRARTIRNVRIDSVLVVVPRPSFRDWKRPTWPQNGNPSALSANLPTRDRWEHSHPVRRTLTHNGLSAEIYHPNEG
jgi:hypothetical protein